MIRRPIAYLFPDLAILPSLRHTSAAGRMRTTGTEGLGTIWPQQDTQPQHRFCLTDQTAPAEQPRVAIRELSTSSLSALVGHSGQLRCERHESLGPLPRLCSFVPAAACRFHRRLSAGTAKRILWGSSAHLPADRRGEGRILTTHASLESCASGAPGSPAPPGPNTGQKASSLCRLCFKRTDVGIGWRIWRTGLPVFIS